MTLKDLIDQSISDVQLLLNMMVCEDETDQKICEEILNNIADRLGKALDMTSEIAKAAKLVKCELMKGDNP